MGRFSSLMLALLLGAVSAVALASCGGGSDAKLLPGTTANQIESNLDQVQTLVKSGDCVGAEDAVAEVSAEVEELNDVAAKLKAALEEGTGRLSEVVSRCEEESEEEGEEAEPSREADVEAEELEQEGLEAEEKAEKAQEKAEKQEQKVEEKAEDAEEAEEGTLPPQSEGKGKAKGHEEAPPPTFEPEPAPEETESGGVSPGVGVE